MSTSKRPKKSLGLPEQYMRGMLDFRRLYDASKARDAMYDDARPRGKRSSCWQQAAD